MKKSTYLVTVLLVLGGGLFFIQCKAAGTSDSSGGSGADFDATQYYTRNETDTKIGAARVLFYANETAKTINTVGYAGGASWANASGCMGMILQVEVTNSSGTDKYLQFAYGDSASGGGNPLSFTILNGETKKFPGDHTHQYLQRLR